MGYNHSPALHHPPPASFSSQSNGNLQTPVHAHHRAHLHNNHPTTPRPKHTPHPPNGLQPHTNPKPTNLQRCHARPHPRLHRRATLLPTGRDRLGRPAQLAMGDLRLRASASVSPSFRKHSNISRVQSRPHRSNPPRPPTTRTPRAPHASNLLLLLHHSPTLRLDPRTLHKTNPRRRPPVTPRSRTGPTSRRDGVDVGGGTRGGD